MVKNRNWQNRVELAEAQRVESKQRKQRRDNRSTYKSNVLDLLAWLDRQPHTNDNVTFHLWVDCKPVRKGASIKNNEDDDFFDASHAGSFRGKKGRRSGSCHEWPTAGQNSRERRSTSFGEASTKKGRTRRSVSFGGDSDSSMGLGAPLLCRQHFFVDSCNRGKKASNNNYSTSCRHEHYYRPETLTLAQVALCNNCNSSKEEAFAMLVESSEASISASAGDLSMEPDFALEAMDMVYHLTVSGRDDSDVKSRTPSELINNILSTNSCALGSIVYLTIGSELVFDRYLLYQGEKLRSSSVVSESGLRQQSEHGDDSYHVQEEEASAHLLRHIVSTLPCHILEYTLMFLPDDAAGRLSLVCKGWYNEIGKHSPALWKHLLGRHNWPISEAPSLLVGTTSQEARDAHLFKATDRCREAFISHHIAVHHVIAVAEGLIKITGSSLIESSLVDGKKDSIVQKFNARRGAPQYPNTCIAVRIWSPTRALSVYELDCTLRLFEALPTNSANHSGTTCREVVCVRVAPSPNSKKRTCRLIAVDLDNEFVGCLCDVRDVGMRSAGPFGGSRNLIAVEYYLTILRRDDFLCAAGGGGDGVSALEKGALIVINVRDGILDYLLDLNEEIDGLGYFQAFVAANDDDTSEVEVYVSTSVVVCGNDRFMVEASISVPNFEDFDEDGPTMKLLFRWLFIFSSKLQRVVWMRHSFLEESLRNSNQSLVSVRSSPSKARGTTSIAITSPASPAIYCVNLGWNLDSNEFIEEVQGSRSMRSNFIMDGWAFNSICGRPIAMVGNNIIVVDNLEKEVFDHTINMKCVVSFYNRPTHGNSSELSPQSSSTLTLEGECRAVRIEPLRDNHVLLICRVRPTKTETFDDNEDEEAFDGNWFDPGEEAAESVFIILIHIPTRQEIARFDLGDASYFCPKSLSSDLQIMFASDGSSAAAAMGSSGIVLTGHDMRIAGRNRTTSFAGDIVDGSDKGSVKKKKKKRQPNRGGKKDAFARGMTLGG
eukprot:CAMPEP_0198286052 /NCGR_PEP_ID=MMETSP1449-20131203/5218_1 /TAXON_ID=420275 /ORGANISM="Attheya septentrionalis, Strain CCMP2084" /LENGTH=997 /DNA_ID=CAMNT_0043983671 /DNA_START=107 /DNA_END=3100 /DNA_ORIENTATION=-